MSRFVGREQQWIFAIGHKLLTWVINNYIFIRKMTLNIQQHLCQTWFHIKNIEKANKEDKIIIKLNQNGEVMWKKFSADKSLLSCV